MWCCASVCVVAMSASKSSSSSSSMHVAGRSGSGVAVMVVVRAAQRRRPRRMGRKICLVPSFFLLFFPFSFGSTFCRLSPHAITPAFALQQRSHWPVAVATPSPRHFAAGGAVHRSVLRRRFGQRTFFSRSPLSSAGLNSFSFFFFVQSSRRPAARAHESLTPPATAAAAAPWSADSGGEEGSAVTAVQRGT